MSLVIPTPREGVFLRGVTEVEDSAWFLANRRFKHPVPPHKPGSPDHFAYRKLRQQRITQNPNITSLGIWHKTPKPTLAFIGIASLCLTDTELPPTAELGVNIIDRYQQRGYATVALQGLMTYAQQQHDIKVFTADVLSRNEASKALFEHLGFEATHDVKAGHTIYAHTISS